MSVSKDGPVALKAVAFDVDGTLYPNASMYWRSVGMALGNLRLLLALERARGDLRDVPDASDSFHHVQARRVASYLKVSPERAYARIEGQVYTRWFRIFRNLKTFPGVRDTLLAFRGAGLKLAAVSDFPIRHRLEDLGLGDLWDVTFSSEETGYLKPNPQPFHELARRLGLPPQDILYVGNSHRYDVEGARAAGMDAAHLTKKPHPDSHAVFSFLDYRDLRDFVFRRLGDPGYDGATGRVPC